MARRFLLRFSITQKRQKITGSAKYNIIAIYPTAVKSVLCHEKTRDILFLERPQGAREIKFREFSSDIKGLLAVGYVVLSHEARVN